MKSLYQHNKGGKHEFLSFEDLKFVKKLMSIDLTNVINWDKSAEDSHIYPTPTPYHHEAFNDKYWKELSSKKFYINEPIHLTNGQGILNFTLDIDALVNYLEDPHDVDKSSFV